MKIRRKDDHSDVVNEEWLQELANTYELRSGSTKRYTVFPKEYWEPVPEPEWKPSTLHEVKKYIGHASPFQWHYSTYDATESKDMPLLTASVNGVQFGAREMDDRSFFDVHICETCLEKIGKCLEEMRSGEGRAG